MISIIFIANAITVFNPNFLWRDKSDSRLAPNKSITIIFLSLHVVIFMFATPFLGSAMFLYILASSNNDCCPSLSSVFIGIFKATNSFVFLFLASNTSPNDPELMYFVIVYLLISEPIRLFMFSFFDSIPNNNFKPENYYSI